MSMHACGELRAGELSSPCLAATILHRMSCAVRAACTPVHGACVSASATFARAHAQRMAHLTNARADTKSQAWTLPMSGNEEDEREKAGKNEVAQSPAAVPAWARWRRGLEAPPFRHECAAAIAYMRSILRAIPLTPLHAIPLTEGMALQIYWLHCGAAADAELACASHAGLYVVLASLAHGVRVHDPSRAACARLRVFFERSGSTAPGLAIAFRLAVKNRSKHAKLKGLGLEEARERLVRLWDECPLLFEFDAPTAACSVASGGGGVIQTKIHVLLSCVMRRTRS